jgi:hypothetical protein
MRFARSARRSALLLASLCLALPATAQAPPAERPDRQCMIKGNINGKGERIYHPPGCRYYGSTIIDPQRGERWFCSEQEAVAAGWRRTKVC